MATDDQRELNDLREMLAGLRRRLEAMEWQLKKLSDEPLPTEPPPLPSVSTEPPPDPEPVSSPPPPAQVAATDAPPTAVPAKKAGTSFEQRIGVGWLGRIGVIVLLLAAVFFFQYAARQGWINPAMRVLAVTAFGLLLVGMGEWTLRKGMWIFSACVTGGGLAMLYAAAYVASPNFYDLVPAPVAFAFMCAVTALGIGLSLRSKAISTALLAQVGAYLTPLLVSTGENQQVGLMVYLLVVSAGFLCVAGLKRWQALAPVALLGATLLFVAWCVEHYTDDAFVLTVAFGWAMCAAFVVYGVIAAGLGRAYRELAAIIVGVSTVLLSILIIAAGSSWVAILGQLLALNAIVLVISWVRSWRGLEQVALAWTLVAFVRACDMGEPSWALAAWGWAFFALCAAEKAVGRMRRPSAVADNADAILFTEAGVGLAVLLLVASGVQIAVMWHVLALAVATLGISWVRRWPLNRAAALAWTAGAFAIVAWRLPFMNNPPPQPSLWPLAIWAWALFALFTADVWARLKKRLEPWERKVDAALATAATALMAGATGRLLDEVWGDTTMAVYIGALAAAAIIAAVVLRKRTGRRVLSYAYLGQGLILAALVAPIATDRASVTIAWSVQAAVTMFLASRLKERMLLVKSVALLMVAVVHFVSIDHLGDAGADVLWSTGGVDVCVTLLTAAIMMVSFFVALAVLPGAPLIPEKQDATIVGSLLAVVGTGVWLVETARRLSGSTVTWWWLAAPVLLLVVGFIRRKREAAFVALAVFAAAVWRFVFFDTLRSQLVDGADTARWIICNWQSLLGVVLAGGALVWGVALARRVKALAWLATILILAAAVLVVWTGSFEVDRAFAIWQARSDSDLTQARQMTYSLWWAACAIGLVVAGLLARHAPSRYLALGLFGLTVGKVLLVDMANVETVWRILSFLALGSVLVGASLAYQRYFARSES